jgi:pimeloyl-ACP methyl ester carboxylesterase
LVLVSAPTLPWPGTIDILYRVTGNPVGAALAVPLLTAFVTDGYLDKSLEGIFAPAAVPEGYEKFIGAGLSIRRSSLRANGKQVDILRDQLVVMQLSYANLTLPIELVHGDLDKSVPLDIHARPLSEILPNATLTIIVGAGHLPHHSHADTVIAAINRAATRAQLR